MALDENSHHDAHQRARVRRKRHRRALSAAVVVTAAGLALSACGGSSPATTAAPVPGETPAVQNLQKAATWVYHHYSRPNSLPTHTTPAARATGGYNGPTDALVAQVEKNNLGLKVSIGPITPDRHAPANHIALWTTGVHGGQAILEVTTGDGCVYASVVPNKANGVYVTAPKGVVSYDKSPRACTRETTVPHDTKFTTTVP